MAAPRLRVQLALAGAAVAVVVALDSSGALPATAAVVLDDGAQFVAGLFATIACAWMAARTRGVERTWRWLMAGGMGGWSVGQLIWSWYQIFVATPLPSPSWSDVGYLTLPVGGFAALCMLAVGRRPGVPPAPGTPIGRPQPRPVLLLDGLVVVGSVFILTWTTALGAVVHAGAPTRFAFLVAIAYPITDLAMVVMAMQLLTTRPVPAPLRRQVALLGLGLVGLSLSDSIFAYLISSGAATMPPIANTGFVAGPVLVALAALSPARAAAADETGLADRPPVKRVAAAAGWVHLLLPYLPLVAAGALVLQRLATGGHVDEITIVAGVGVLALVVVRQLITLIDNNTLLARIAVAQDELTHQAFHDPLTGLANRSLFADRLAEAVEPRALAVTPMALLFIDLDDFKAVNDRWGHSVGDQILRAAGERLRDCVRGVDTVARLGGDEFGVLLVGDLDHQLVGERILASLAEPFRVGARSVTIRASIGLAVPEATAAAVSADGLLRRADTAMYAGKHNGKGALVRYHPDLNAHPAEPDLAGLLAAELHAGAAGSGLDVVYQPIVSMPLGRLVAVEALVRWSHPSTGAVPATKLVAMAECAGLIAALDDFVLNRACREIAAYRDRHGNAPLLHVNVSPGRLGDSDLEETVQAALRRHGLEPGHLVLEVTESHAIADLTAASRTVRRLRRTGVRLALDDFGTGYNTLVQLDRLPVDIIKLDSRLTAIGRLPSRTETLCAAVIALADRLGMSVIAEGVEHPAQQTALIRSGARYGQGYLYGRPGPLPAAPAADRVDGGPVVAATIGE